MKLNIVGLSIAALAALGSGNASLAADIAPANTLAWVGG